MASNKKIVLAYSGGLDTSVAIRWLQKQYDAEIVTLTIDLGANADLEESRSRALEIGAIRADVVDLREEFITEYVWPALQAGALYEGVYPLATALGRPLIAKHLIRIAQEEGAFAIAHGCTGKGNDQVRFDVSAAALAPDLKVLAPAREWGMGRDEEIEYAKREDIPLKLASPSAYSTDENLWGRSVEAGSLEDPWFEPPEDAYVWTSSIKNAPEQQEYIEIEFDKGKPIGLNGKPVAPLLLVQTIHDLASRHGIGRIDHIENRLVGIKSREIYEAPAATVLNLAQKSLESMVLTKDQARFKERMASEYADLVYNGLWFSAHRIDLDAYVRSTQQFVSGTVRLRLLKGSVDVVGRKSELALYQHELATYDTGDTFDHKSSEGFINIYGLPTRTQARIQGKGIER
ncbi:MAG: argininosuccinate synthase [Gammaproteobacteria bacterium]|nr:argininosuccinate synthase [Gammaproteobacteria bacterium]